MFENYTEGYWEEVHFTLKRLEYRDMTKIETLHVVSSASSQDSGKHCPEPGNIHGPTVSHGWTWCVTKCLPADVKDASTPLMQLPIRETTADRVPVDPEPKMI
ncbi:hypothetical protein PIB30_084657 [Stylosanthes scabra]|uniref:Uncharacterized protein n=1 Tax=Stylosanthes scabra TaxID=79078 RepID=A0ABU6URF1_9FABA|nr:hypothetical protein [Stylosanthes scabra]